MSSRILPTLRSRLTLLYIASTTVVLLLLSGLFSLLLWVALHNQIDHHIHIITTQAEQVVNNFAGEQRELLLNNLVQMGGMSLILIRPDGSVAMQKNSADIPSLNQKEIQEVSAESSKIGQHPLHFTIHEQRFGSAVVEESDQPMLLAVGYSTRILRETFTQMVGLVIGMILLTLLPLAYCGHKLLQKYLHPLETIAATAKEINHPKNLSRRVVATPLTQEVATIITAFNEMLSRLETVFKTEHEFFSDAAHTLKTPLAVLRAKIERMTKESEMKKQEIIKSIDSAVDTVQDLLLISRIEAGTIESTKRIKVSDIVAELVEIAVSLSEEKKVRVTTNIEAGVTLRADERLMKKAFGNVLHNAVQYVNKSGAVSIHLHQDDEGVKFEVTNTGGALSKDEVFRVFDRFYRGGTSQLSTEGSGLGLAITKAVVENYKGTVKFDVDHRGNVTVKIWLPK